MSLFCFLFWHRWRPQAVKSGKAYHGSVVTEVPARHYTDVLYRCTGCSKLKVVDLDGTWTLEQLLLGEEMSDPRTSGTRV